METITRAKNRWDGSKADSEIFAVKSTPESQILPETLFPSLIHAISSNGGLLVAFFSRLDSRFSSSPFLLPFRTFSLRLFTSLPLSVLFPSISSFQFYHLSLSLFFFLFLFFSRSVRLPRYILLLSLHLFLFLLSLSVLSPRQPRLSSGFSIKCLRTCHLSGFVLSCFLFALEKYTYVRMVIGRRVIFFLFFYPICLIVSSACMRVYVYVCVYRVHMGARMGVFLFVFHWSLFSFQSKAYVQRSSSKNTMYRHVYLSVCMCVCVCVCVCTWKDYK